MPELKEVFEMTANQMGEPDVDSWKVQEKRQRNANRNRKLSAFVLAAAIVVAAVVVTVRALGESAEQAPAGQPSSPPTAAPEATGTIGTVTFDGSTCSMEITADRIEPGVVVFEVVNATDQRAMFDSWQLLDGFTVREFEATIERDRRIFEAGKPGGVFPDQEREVSYLGSEVTPANGSGVLVSSMYSGTHAIVCLQPISRPAPFGVVGPIVIR